MFTGIIEGQGRVLELKSETGSIQFHLRTEWKDLSLGESISVNGVCLTVAEIASERDAFFFVSTESLKCTQFSTLAVGDLVNLERAATLQTRFSGHYVQGHVDGVARLLEIQAISGSYLLKFELPAELARYCVTKGSITLNGISLTLNSISTQSASLVVIEVMIIPHTWSHTNLSSLKAGDLVNVEVDILAKYVERLCRH